MSECASVHADRFSGANDDDVTCANCGAVIPEGVIWDRYGEDSNIPADVLCDACMAQAQTPQPTTTTADREQRERERERERQYRLDTIIARYVAAYTAWQNGNGPFPAVRAFTAELSVADAAEVLEFALYLAVFGDSAPIDEPPDLSLSPAGERAMAAIRAQHNERQA